MSASTPTQPPAGIHPNFGGFGEPHAPSASAAPAPRDRARIGDGILLATAAAIVAGVAWWAVTATTERVWVYGAVLVGVLVGRAMHLGARRGGAVQAILAAVLTIASLAVAEYFIQRSLAISQGGLVLPLWLGFDRAVEIVEGSIEADALTAVFWGIAAVVAIASSLGRNSR